MANIEKKFTQATDKILYLFPHVQYGLNITSWGDNSVEATEDESPNLGRYSVTLDDTYRYWYVFEGEDQPIDWDQWVDVVDIYDGITTSNDLSDSAIAKINQYK